MNDVNKTVDQLLDEVVIQLRREYRGCIVRSQECDRFFNLVVTTPTGTIYQSAFKRFVRRRHRREFVEAFSQCGCLLAPGRVGWRGRWFV